MGSKNIEPFYAVLGANIQDARQKRGMTQAELGHLLEPPATRASVANVENGKQRVLAHTLAQVARSLEVDISELLPTTGRPQRSLNPKEVERELQKKLGLTPPLALKKLAASLATRD